MSALMKSVKILNRIIKNPATSCPLIRNASHWNKDWKPGPYPKTDEERRAAAKKYGLLPEDYKPYPDEGQFYGDYPHLPDVPVEQKDITYPYDNPEMRRNFGEVVHADIDYHDEVHAGIPAPLRYSFLDMYLCFFGVVGGCFLVTWLLEDKKMFRPAMPKHLPGDGQKHYTFEPAR